MVALLLLGVICVLIVRAPLSALLHDEADLAAIVLVYGLLFLWLRANRGAWLIETYNERTQPTTDRTDWAGADSKGSGSTD